MCFSLPLSHDGLVRRPYNVNADKKKQKCTINSKNLFKHYQVFLPTQHVLSWQCKGWLYKWSLTIACYFHAQRACVVLHWVTRCDENPHSCVVLFVTTRGTPTTLERHSPPQWQTVKPVAEIHSRNAAFLSHLSEVIAINFLIISQLLLVNVLPTESRSLGGRTHHVI